LKRWKFNFEEIENVGIDKQKTQGENAIFSKYARERERGRERERERERNCF